MVWQNYILIGTHCVHVGSAVHALWTCLFTDTHCYMPNNIVGRALYSALPTKIGTKNLKDLVDNH